MGGWPIREVMLSYLARLREEAWVAYRHAQLLWQVGHVFGGKGKPPTLPALLRESDS